MSRINHAVAGKWRELSPRFLPFADVATPELPLGRLLRLSLFQVSVGMAVVLLIGTLNRVMIVELAVPAWLVALMVSLPLVLAPFRALVGFRSDTHRSLLGWRRVPYLWMGTLLQFGGFAIMPFALIVLSGDTHGPPIIGEVGAALAFLLVGAGLHTTQTAGLALATDLAPPEAQPRVVRPLMRDAARGHGGKRPRLRGLPREFQRDPPDPGGSGRGADDDVRSIFWRCGSRRRATRSAPRLRKSVRCSAMPGGRSPPDRDRAAV